MTSEKNKRVFHDSDEAIVTVNFADSTYQLKNCFIGGRSVEDEFPVGVYSGVLDISEMGISLLSMFRAIVRTTREEMGMPAKATEDFLLFCMYEALKKESDEAKRQVVADFVNNYFKNQL